MSKQTRFNRRSPVVEWLFLGTKASDAASLAAAQAAIEGANKPMLCAKCTDPVEAALSAAPPAQEVDSGEQVRNVRSILEDFRAITESEVRPRQRANVRCFLCSGGSF